MFGEEGVVAAGGLGPALQYVAGDHSACEGVQVGGRPPVVRDARPRDQRGVGDPAGHHDVRARAQALGDAERPEVRVGGQQRAARVLARPAELGGAGQQFVAGDVPDPGVDALPAGELAERLGEAGRVEAARVDHDPHAAVDGLREALLGLPQEGPRVAEARVAQAVAGQDQHRQLGQVVAGEDVQRAAGQHLAERREPVPVEPRSIADPQHGASPTPRRQRTVHPGPGRAAHRAATEPGIRPPTNQAHALVFRRHGRRRRRCWKVPRDGDHVCQAGCRT